MRDWLAVPLKLLSRTAFVGFVSALYVLIPITSAVAQDVGALQRTVQSRICPTDRSSYAELTFAGYGCKTICCDHSRNGGDCGGCLVGYEPQCQAEVRQKNEIIRSYNHFVSGCSTTRHGSPTPPNPSSKPQPGAAPPGKKTPLEQALERQKLKAKDADKVQAEEKARVQQKVKDSNQEMTKLKAAKAADQERDQLLKSDPTVMSASRLPPPREGFVVRTYQMCAVAPGLYCSDPDYFCAEDGRCHKDMRLFDPKKIPTAPTPPGWRTLD
jgi:hypothetical protein